MTSNLDSPVAILDKELANYPSYTIETFELCDCCGARFAIGYHERGKQVDSTNGLSTELPNTLRQMLAEDHGHDRKHKQFTEIWVFKL